MNKLERPKKDIAEIFGYAPNDCSKACRSLWALNACPFVGLECSKWNHDKTICLGVCSVSSPNGKDCVVCPRRFYGNHYRVLEVVSNDVFGEIPFLTFQEYVEQRESIDECVVALGHDSGREVGRGLNMSMDWVLAHVKDVTLVDYTGIEVQSIDITGNYRDNWYAYKNIESATVIPSSEHGMNWANVHKRLIPQLIRKGIVYSRSNYVKVGLNFIVPDVVFQKFEEILGDMTLQTNTSPNNLTVYTYDLSDVVEEGKIRELILNRKLTFNLEEFSQRFISGPNLPSGDVLDNDIKSIIGVK